METMVIAKEQKTFDEVHRSKYLLDEGCKELRSTNKISLESAKEQIRLEPHIEQFSLDKSSCEFSSELNELEASSRSARAGRTGATQLRLQELKEEEQSRTDQMRSEHFRTAQKECNSYNHERYGSVSDQIGALQQISSHKKRRAQLIEQISSEIISDQHKLSDNEFRRSTNDIKWPHLPMYDEGKQRHNVRNFTEAFQRLGDLSNSNFRPEAIYTQAELMCEEGVSNEDKPETRV
ncbi:hypothetical protein F511_14593 [Dorcoceras hygrometricum]|uniref:Uncharacterized protein n=1 Tax=Dorcoceras hygrometricum TaxID=472368 RepID=A0A2Z7CKA4_9LAMI|nr:hypothetical protein F511_14593 [Dorcoceras hygrometricum]